MPDGSCFVAGGALDDVLLTFPRNINHRLK